MRENQFQYEQESESQSSCIEGRKYSQINDVQSDQESKFNERRSRRSKQQTIKNNRIGIQKYQKKTNELRESDVDEESDQDGQGNEYSSKLTLSQKQVDLYYQKKNCQVCFSPKEKQLFLCDRCDDAYHDYCINESLEQEQNKRWICPPCRVDVNKLEYRMQIQRNQNVYQPQNCFLCNKTFEQPERIQAIRHGNVVQIEIEGFLPQKCLYCQKKFHYTCFNPRCNAVNCQKCQKIIRKEGPKNHQSFLLFIQKTKTLFTKKRYRTISPSENYKKDKKYKKQEKSAFLQLKLPGALTYWQLIARYEASLYYAFKTKKLYFVQDQVYDSPQAMKLNCHQGEPSLRSLDQRDQKVFQKFKQNTRNGIVGPFQIRQDRIKGFYLVTTDFLEKNTIICEYVGQVMTQRKSLNYEKNDSIFMLIKNPSSRKSLDIVPNQFCNISRFLLGINNKKKSQSKKLLNVKAIRFQYQGRARVLFYCKRDIQAGQTLYINYNGTAFQQYPTDHFS